VKQALEPILSHKEEVRKFLITNLDLHKLGSINKWHSDAIDRLVPFSTTGKLIRGCLVMYVQKMLNENESALFAAAAVELVHSGFLIHDDIMDQDLMRRGSPSMHAQYQNENSNKHYSEGMAICVGDVAFFLASSMLAQTKRPDIVSYATKEWMYTTFAQMDDVSFSYIENNPSIESILNVYHYKTARYSFSVPLTIGAMIAGASDELIESLSKFGDAAGILFQIRDDELGLFGTTKETGKPIGSDIRENKKTLFRHILYSLALPDEIKKLNTIFGKEAITDEDILYVKQVSVKHNVNEKINSTVKKYSQNAADAVVNLPKPMRETFSAMIEYILERRN